MQTFVPLKSFQDSARVLDYRRLGKQRVETWQIYNTLVGNSHGWRNHPAVKMWAGYEAALLLYGMTICTEWQRRGYKDTLYKKMEDEFKAHRYSTNIILPPWFGDDRIHSSHRSNLLRKDLNFYSKYGWKENDSQDYYWPV